jgi:hypothetical protein
MFNAEILPPVVVPPSGTPPGDELVEPMYAVGDASGVLAKADVEPKVPTALFPGTGVTFIALAGAAVRSSLPHTRNGENLPTSNEAVPDIVRFLYVVGAVSVVVPALIERSEAVLQSPNISTKYGVGTGRATLLVATRTISPTTTMRLNIRLPRHRLWLS